MSTIQEQEKLIEVLKFTPRTYKIRLWGYGGEYVMGTVDRKIYDYFKERRLDISEFAWDSDYADANNIPEEMQPFYPGSWHDCDDMGHCWGVDRSAGTLQVEDENGEVVYEKRLEDICGMGVDEENPEASEPEWAGGDEIWIDMKEPGTVVFVATSSEKGTFFEGDLELKTPFNPGKISLCYDEIDGNEIITSVTYNEEDVDNWGGDTSGKGTDHAFYIAGSNKQDGKGYERYRNMDDIEYTTTDWFPKKIKPVREGHYEVKTKDGYTYRANWNGEDWYNTWGDDPDKVKIKEWRGIAYNPDEQDLRDELDRIALEVPGFPNAEMLDELEKMNCVQCDWSGTVEDTFSNDRDEMVCPKCSSPVEFTDSKEEPVADPMNPWASSTPTEPKELTWWTVKTLDKKSVTEVEEFVKDGMTLTHTTGFRWGSWQVATNDGQPPEFVFEDGQIDINSCYENNIEEVELNSMDDGCYEDYDWPEGISDEEQEKAQTVIDEESVYELESHGWYHSETYVYLSGPLEISNEAGEVVKVVNE